MLELLLQNIDHLTIRPWNKQNDFPVFLRSSYNFYEMAILGRPCILIEVIDEMLEIPGDIFLGKAEI